MTQRTDPAAETDRRDLYAEDLRVGEPIPLGRRTVPEAEILDFAREWDPQLFQTDRDFAAAGHFEQIIASGIHTLAVFQRLAVDGAYHRWRVIAGRGIRNLRLPAPVRPGDVLTGTLVVESVQPDGRGRADVLVRGTLQNQDGITVLELELESLMRTRAS